MKKKVMVGVAAGLAVVIILLLWALIAGLGYLWKQAPALTESGKQLASEALKKAEGAFTELRQSAEKTAPGLQEKVRDIIPFGGIPERDVAGEDIRPVPRFPGMVRSSYTMVDKKRTVVYKGKVAYRAVVDFYQKEMAALGFQSRVISASPEAETYEYRKGGRVLVINFEKAAAFPSEITSMTVREAQPDRN